MFSISVGSLALCLLVVVGAVVGAIALLRRR
jgi:hypothetical protein